MVRFRIPTLTNRGTEGSPSISTSEMSEFFSKATACNLSLHKHSVTFIQPEGHKITILSFNGLKILNHDELYLNKQGTRWKKGTTVFVKVDEQRLKSTLRLEEEADNPTIKYFRIYSRPFLQKDAVNKRGMFFFKPRILFPDFIPAPCARKQWRYTMYSLHLVWTHR